MPVILGRALCRAVEALFISICAAVVGADLPEVARLRVARWLEGKMRDIGARRHAKRLAQSYQKS